MPPLAAPGESPSTSSTRTSARHAESTHQTPRGRPSGDDGNVTTGPRPGKYGRRRLRRVRRRLCVRFRSPGGSAPSRRSAAPSPCPTHRRRPGFYLSDAPLRRRVTAATNKVESFNRFSQWIGFGNRGVVRPETRRRLHPAARAGADGRRSRPGCLSRMGTGW
ncbi:Tn3 family transposase [Streptomyces sp. CG1]|uniref:Tn3 family transposase n=1 Tax=Streptomyces sp. CG1 TaxID=1287523 RepID=UPI0034E25656